MAQPLLTDFTKTESGAPPDTVWGSAKGMAEKTMTRRVAEHERGETC